MIRQSLTEELNASRPPASITKDAASNTSTNGRTQPRMATAKQVKALFAIAKQRGFDLTKIVRDRYALDRPELFTIQQASELIDSLNGE